MNQEHKTSLVPSQRALLRLRLMARPAGRSGGGRRGGGGGRNRGGRGGGCCGTGGGGDEGRFASGEPGAAGGHVVSPCMKGSRNPGHHRLFQCRPLLRQDDDDALHVGAQLGVGLRAQEAHLHAQRHLLRVGGGLQSRIHQLHAPPLIVKLPGLR